MKKILSIMLVLCFVASMGYSASEWDKDGVAGTLSPSSIDDYNDLNMEALDRGLSKYQRNCSLAYASASTLTINIGEVVCSNAGGTIRKMRANTSAVTLSWSDIDTGAEASGTTYYVYAVADADATTFTGLISTSTSTPTGATYYTRLGYFDNNASGNIDMGSIVNDDNYYGLVLGDWVSKSSDTIYQASTGGFVVGRSSGGESLKGYTDSSSSPTTLRVWDDSSSESSICMPVKKGDYYTVIDSGSSGVLYWIPME